MICLFYRMEVAEVIDHWLVSDPGHGKSFDCTESGLGSSITLRTALK